MAHLGYIRHELVERRRFVDDAAYADLVALCQLLPGPASSQLVFALGLRRAGLAGALVASLCFTLPSALLMLAFALGVVRFDVAGAGFVHGLRLAAVGVVAQAVWSMGVRLCPDRPRQLVALGAAVVVLVAAVPAAALAVIVAGGVAGVVSVVARARGAAAAAADVAPAATRPGLAGAVAALVVFAVVVAFALVVDGAAADASDVGFVAGFVRAGALVFGGGHVVLPLLRDAVVVPGGLSDETFLAGYAAAQAVPGPLFSFAAFLGAALHPSSPALGAAVALLALFAPGFLLVAGAAPFWARWRQRPALQGASQGANAAVVGVLLAALYDPVIHDSIGDHADVACAVVAFALLQIVRAPPWAVVLACAAAGQWLLPR